MSVTAIFLLVPVVICSAQLNGTVRLAVLTPALTVTDVLLVPSDKTILCLNAEEAALIVNPTLSSGTTEVLSIVSDELLGISVRENEPETDPPERDVPASVNSPETDVFIKGNTLYNYSNALPYIKKEKKMYICEGFMDCIALSKANIKIYKIIVRAVFAYNYLKILIS